MTTIALPQLPGHDLLTHSRLTAFRSCRRRAMFQYHAGIVRVGERKPLRIGGAFHLGLELEAKGADAHLAIANAIETYYAWSPADDDQLYEWEIERETTCMMLQSYFWRWNIDGIPDELRIKKWLATEQEFRLPIRNPETDRATTSFEFGGKIDGIVELGTGELAVIEHKTCGEEITPDSDYWRVLDIDPQISGYVLAARELGFPVTTVLYDVARKPTIKPSQRDVLDDDGVPIVVDTETGERAMKKDGTPYRSGDEKAGRRKLTRAETAAEFAKRHEDAVVADPDRFFQRRQIPRLDYELEDFRHELWQTQQDMRACENGGRFWRNTAVCRRPFPCDYLAICPTYRGGDSLPQGYRRVESLHPELNGEEPDDAQS